MNWKNCYLTKDKANTSIDCSLSSNYTVTSKLKIHVNINIKSYAMRTLIFSQFLSYLTNISAKK